MNHEEHATPARVQPEPAATASTDSRSTLREEHALLMREVTARAEMVLREADEGRWPDAPLRELLNYLHLEVLRQITDTEWLLFRTAHQAPDELARLRHDHLELRLAIDALTQAAALADSTAGPSPLGVAAATRDLLAQLEGHFSAEQRLLTTTGNAAPSTASLGSQPHDWYALTEGPVIDLDQLPGEQGIDAALARLLRLAPDEQVDLRCSSDPSPLWQRLARADPGGYGLTYRERGPRRWRLEITRRGAHSTPHPYA
jgi:uncharacterized protein (DUF2249 family)